VSWMILKWNESNSICNLSFNMRGDFHEEFNFFQLIILANMLDLSLFYLIIHNALSLTMLLCTLFATWSFWICMYDITFCNYKTKITCVKLVVMLQHIVDKVNFVLCIMNCINLFKVISILINFNWRRNNQMVLASISLLVIQ
jgi:hypothetical protein